MDLDELVQEGTISKRAVDEAPELVAAVEGGLQDAAVLRALAAMSTGEPARLAERIRPLVAAGEQAYLRLLDANDPEVRAAAASVLVAAAVGDVDRLARLADDEHPLVRMTAALAFGVLSARIGVVERLLEDEDASVRYAAALALQRVARIDQRVVQMLLLGAVTEDGDVPREQPPWDALYPEAYDAVLQLGSAMLEPALPFLLDRIARGERTEAVGAAELALELGFGAPSARPKAPKRLTQLQRHVLERIAAGGNAWKARTQMDELMRDYGLPGKRRDLEGWLKQAGDTRS